MVDALVDKCQKGGWLNFIYLNNFAQDIYKPGFNLKVVSPPHNIRYILAGTADCINVSWYMAIDMQYFILTPILLSLIWKKPKIGYSVWLALFCAGTACQVTFTILDDEYFHGGFSYYIKPWNRSQPYLIGILLGIFLHKVKSKKLKCFSMLSIFILEKG